LRKGIKNLRTVGVLAEIQIGENVVLAAVL
jgi:hypothetical protein